MGDVAVASTQILRWLPWALLGAGVAVGLGVRDPVSGRVDAFSLLLWEAAFFIILITRLVLTLRRSPGRRAPFAALLVGLLLWLAGSAVVSLSEGQDVAAFPGPGEGLFLSAYVCLAAFVFLDAQGLGTSRSLASWVDAVILAGGAGVLTATLVLVPLSRAYPTEQFALVAAGIYPVIDLGLAVLVIVQWGVGLRPRGLRTAWLLIGFCTLAIADTTLVLGVPSGAYVFTLAADLIWAAAFGLIVESACMHKQPDVALGHRRLPRVLVIAAFVVALILLIVRPGGPLSLVIALSSALVVAAGGVRLFLALRESEDAVVALQARAVDDLTGLPNRSALIHGLEDAMAASGRAGLLLIDVQDFHEVNDSIGHTSGDYVLRLLAGRISEVTSQGCLVCRTDGDEFGVLAPTDDPVVLSELAKAIRSRAGETVGLDGLDLSLCLNIGIGWLKPDDTQPADVMRRADVALYSAWTSGTGIDVYHVEDDPFTRQRLELAADLREAVRNHRLTLAYMPTVDSVTGAVTSLEALVRWTHAERGPIAPAHFLPLARRDGLMLELSRQVVDRAMTDLAGWRSAGLDVTVSINIAPAELHTGVLVEHVLAQAASMNVTPGSITLEVSEDSFRIEPDQARRALIEAAAAGLRTSIDDYGSGFNSLAYLRDLPVAEVKLDRAFCASVITDQRSAVIITSTVAMAHALGMRVVAEGVENQHAASRAIVLGVDALQGYYMSRPLSAEEVPEFVTGVAVG